MFKGLNWMKGVVFNLLEEVVCKELGENAWDRLLDDACVDGAYTSLGSYPDDQLERLVAAAAIGVDSSSGDILRWFGRYAIPLLQGRYPVFFDGHASARSFVLTLNSIIHPEVRKLYPGARCPAFHFSDSPDGDLILQYASPRKMCMLAHGFLEGAAAFFGECSDIRHVSCMNTGGLRCELAVSFS